MLSTLLLQAVSLQHSLPVGAETMRHDGRTQKSLLQPLYHGHHPTSPVSSQTGTAICTDVMYVYLTLREEKETCNKKFCCPKIENAIFSNFTWVGARWGYHQWVLIFTFSYSSFLYLSFLVPRNSIKFVFGQDVWKNKKKTVAMLSDFYPHKTPV